MKEFEKLYEAYFDKVYYYLITLSKNNKISEDIAQDTFFKALQYISANKDAYINCSWLIKVARNTYIDYVRKNKKVISLNESLAASDTITESLLKTDFTRMLESIPDKYKNILLLKYYFNFTSEEISQMLDTSDTAVRTMLFRARKKLKEVYNKNEKW